MLPNDPQQRAVLEARFMAQAHPEPNSGCWLWDGALNMHGYGDFRHFGRRSGPHRISYALFVADIPDGSLVCHKCDVRCCVNPDHLFLGTNSTNMRDMYAKGRGRKQVRLTPALVKEIRLAPSSHKEAAQRFGVKPCAIRDARVGKTWSYV